MTDVRDPEARIAAYFRIAQPELPDRTFDALRVDIERSRQVSVLGPVRFAGSLHGAGFLAAAVILAVAVAALSIRPGGGPGAAPTPTTVATPAPTAVLTPEPPATAPTTPTRFVSPLYGYTVTIPAGWFTAAALIRWDGTTQPGPDVDADRFGGPGQLTMWAFAGPFTGDIGAIVADRIAANARDHADTCHGVEPEVNETVVVGSRSWVLIGWNCGGLINQAVTLDRGVAYAFTFRDLAVRAARDGADQGLFLSVLATVDLPS